MTEDEKLELLLRHQTNVREACELLGRKLITAEQAHVGRDLIAHGQIHDNSKFHGIEWEFATDPTCKNRTGLKYAITQHTHANPHHPEYWGGIIEMPEVYVAEMVCDWKARSNEFGRDLREWIVKDAAKRYKFSRNSPVCIKIMEFVDMICEVPFTPIPQP